MKSLIKLAVIFLIFFFGCKTIGPDYREPELKVKDTWNSANRNQSLKILEKSETKEWWKNFNDQTLNELLDSTIQNNLDILVATSRIIEAKYNLGIKQAILFPSLNASFSGTSLKNSNSVVPTVGGGNVGSIGSGIGGLQGGSNQRLELYSIGVDSSWEVDILGKNKRAIESSRAKMESINESHKDTLVSLTSEVTKNYINYRGCITRLELFRENEKIEKETLSLIKIKVKAGFVGVKDLNRQEAQLFSSSSKIPDLERSCKEYLHKLVTLTGIEIINLESKLNSNSGIPVVQSKVSISVPAEILRHRPDLRKAEREIAEQNAKIGQAIAELFPKFSITGRTGIQTRTSSIGLDNLYYSLGPSISVPILEWGKYRNDIEVQNEKCKQSLLNYQKLVLNAIEETENAILAYETEKINQELLDKEVTAYKNNLTYSKILYEKGITDYLTLLDSQKSYYEVRDRQIQNSYKISLRVVNLYKVMGGGWEF
ncbi:MAG: TolC family protein [Spirochaetia bacterium]|nr:TolC family protein [Spirochaetia bacterium]